MILERITIENFRCFEKVDIEFHRNLTVLTANNGLGKTAILEAIAASMSPFVDQFEYGEKGELPSLKETDITRRKVYVESDSGLFNTERSPNASKVVSHFSQNSVQPENLDHQQLHSTVTSDMNRVAQINNESLSAYGKHLSEKLYQNGDNLLLPLVANYSTGRLHAHQTLSLEVNNLEESRTRGYYNSLSAGSSYGHFLNGMKIWALEHNNQVDLQQQGKPASSYFGNLISSVSECIEICMDNFGYQHLHYSFTHNDLILNTPNGALQLSQLSDGIRNIVTMVGDIAYRIHALNPHKRNTKDLGGIVLIDEVDMHLHPSWQQTILGKLQKTFPEVQFIVTTHSPQVLSTVKAESIRVIEDGAVTAATNETLGLDSANVLAQTMGVDPLPDLDINRDYLALVDRIEGGENPTELETDIDKFGQNLGESHPAFHDLKRRLRYVGYKAKLNRSLR